MTLRRVLPALALLALALAAIGATPLVMEALRWIETLGPWGHVCFALLYVVAALVLVPAGLLEAAAGFQYGPWLGVPVAWALGTASASTAFLLGRTLFRPWVERRIAADRRLEAISKGIAKEGAWLVFWLRLSPLAPFNALHMPLGATRIPFGAFVLATAAGHGFPVLLFVLTGAAVDSLTALTEHRPTLPPWGVGLGVATALIASWFVSRIARRAIAASLAEAPPPRPGDPSPR